ncbi:MAG: type 4a pilus biogenesis protein PilO [Marinospirillum sp.]|uniref:type 4a pilus biogenesis protein PilO n=1 Tax=Marinospirillum sp. TaxID=2183934 RepID=UPI0019E4BA31|nr:type 4a pilus biogenesis protein PilO [Marinospirillum sp.]MBE0506328.1 type 4a pilus biogenesis protein PilO [Marinospirillum sp.]
MKKITLSWLDALKLNPQPHQKIRHWLVGQWRAIKRLERDDLDLASAGQWPDSLKILSLLVIIGSVIGVSHWLLLSSSQQQLEQVRQEQNELFETYRVRAFQAANLPAYQQQMVIIEETFSGLLTRLPSENEIPRLLDDIQLQAAIHRLELQALTLQAPRPQAFYTELPFEIRATGDYHHLANFMAGISALDRIVTLHDFNLAPSRPGTPHLTLTIQARTYRYDQNTTTATRRESSR